MISKFFIDRPIFAIVISLLISIFGLLAIATLPVAKYPQVTPPQVRVSATYIGANAEVVGTTVASVIERQLVGVDNLVNMESSTNDNGSYSMTVQFKSGSDGDMDTVNTQNRVSQVQSTLRRKSLRPASLSRNRRVPWPWSSPSCRPMVLTMRRS